MCRSRRLRRGGLLSRPVIVRCPAVAGCRRVVGGSGHSAGCHGIRGAGQGSSGGVDVAGFRAVVGRHCGRDRLTDANRYAVTGREQHHDRPGRDHAEGADEDHGASTAGRCRRRSRSQFGTTAAGGLIYRYANTSSGVTGSAKLYVGFTAGGGIVGSNYAGTLPDIGPGKSGEGEVDAVGIRRPGPELHRLRDHELRAGHVDGRGPGELRGLIGGIGGSRTAFPVVSGMRANRMESIDTDIS